MAAIYAPPVTAGDPPTAWRDAAAAGVETILEGFDALANDAESFPLWWQIIMPVEIPEHPEYWTVGRALARWPLEDRRRRVRLQPCPECELRTVIAIPPAAPGAPAWYSCDRCDWERNDLDDDGLWAAVYSGWEAEPLETSFTGTEEP